MRFQTTTVLIALAFTLACATAPSPTRLNTVVKTVPPSSGTVNSTPTSLAPQRTVVPTIPKLIPTPTETSPTVLTIKTQAPTSGSTPTAAAPGASPAVESVDEELRFLALGDSYTIGESVSVSERWPVQLAQLIRNQGIKIAEPVIVAGTGWTTTDLATEIKSRDTEESFDLVTLMIGVNNQFRGLDFGKYRGEFLALLDTALGFAGGKKANVVVVSIPDYGVTPFASSLDGDLIAREIDQFTDINREEAIKAGVAYVDITGISREAKTDITLLAADGLHPSGKMYSLWAKEIHAEITLINNATSTAQATLIPTPMPTATASPPPTALASPTNVPIPTNAPNPTPFIQPKFGNSVGDTLPHFEFTLIDGTMRSTAQLSSQGRPVFLFFFATW